MPGSGRIRWRVAAAALGVLLFLFAFGLAVALTLPDHFVLSLVRPVLRAQGVDLTARECRIAFPLGVRLRGVSVAAAGIPPIHLDEATASWEWTGMFRWLPAHLALVRGSAMADLRFSPAFWNPSRGRVVVTGLSSEDLTLPVFSEAGAGFSVKRVDARWRLAAGKLAAEGTGTFGYLKIPVPSRDSPIREARIDNVALSFVIRGDALRVPRVLGVYEGSRVDGTGEITRFLVPRQAQVTFHLRVQNPFEGRVAMLFDMLAKNAKNANLRVVGSLAAPRAEFQFF